MLITKRKELIINCFDALKQHQQELQEKEEREYILRMHEEK